MMRRVIVVEEAEQQIHEIDAWWVRNRGGAPDLFLDELAQSFQLLEEFPDIGPRFSRTRRPGIRRLLLRRSQYWLYYFHHREKGIVYILTVWGTSRGTDPILPEPRLP